MSDRRNSREAWEIGKALFRTREGLVYAARRHGFAKKDSDGFHWVYDLNALKRYVDAVRSGWTVQELADAVGSKSKTWVYAKLEAHGILPIYDHNRAFIFKDEDVQGFIAIYREDNHE
jgi:hypothetical protein